MIASRHPAQARHALRHLGASTRPHVLQLFHLQDGQSGATLPSVLADMCHNMISYPANPPALGLDARCSGFAFDNATQIATFKRTNDGSTIDVPGNDEVCNVPTGVEWVRNSGEQCQLLQHSKGRC